MRIAAGRGPRGYLQASHVEDQHSQSALLLVVRGKRLGRRWSLSPLIGGGTFRAHAPVVSRLLLQGAECAGVEDQRVCDRWGVQAVDVSDDDPVVAGGVFGDDLAFEGGDGVGE